MPNDIEAVVGNWYQNLEKGQEFEVIAVDEDSGLIEIQYFGGDVDEMDLESWSDLQLEVVDSPENWTGPMDDIEVDDLDYDETDMEPQDWERPARESSPPSTSSVSGADEEEPDDEWGEGAPSEEPREDINQ